MTGLEIGFLAASIAVDAASIALSIFSFGMATPIAAAISTGVHVVSGALPLVETLAKSKGNLTNAELLSSVGTALINSIPFGSLASVANKASTKVFNHFSKEFAIKANRFFKSVSNKLNKVNQVLDNLSPNTWISKGVVKLTDNFNKQSLLEDAQLIARKTSEQEVYGEVRTDKKINSITYNKNKESWVQSAHFEETKFIDRNNIIGTLTIFYYLNNWSRLNLLKNPALNGNNELRAIRIPDCRYKNDYVSGICSAKSWGSYYMRTWMIGKPDNRPGLNTLIFFGGEWRVDKKIKNLINEYWHPQELLKNHSEKVAKYFIGKTKVGSYLLAANDAYKKTKGLMGGNIKMMTPYLKKGMKKIRQKGIK